MTRPLTLELAITPAWIRSGLALVLMSGLPLELDSQGTQQDYLTMRVTYPSPTAVYMRLITTGSGPSGSNQSILSRYGANVVLSPGSSGEVRMGNESTPSPTGFKLDLGRTAAPPVAVNLRFGYSSNGQQGPGNQDDQAYAEVKDGDNKLYLGNGSTPAGAPSLRSSAGNNGRELVARPGTSGSFLVLANAASPGSAWAGFGPNQGPGSNSGAVIRGHLKVTGKIKACVWVNFQRQTGGSGAKSYCGSNANGYVNPSNPAVGGRWYALYTESDASDPPAGEGYFKRKKLAKGGRMLCCRITD